MFNVPKGLEPPTPMREGRERKVGVELELTGLDVSQLSALVAKHFGGNVSEEHSYRHRVETPLGHFVVEADLAFLQKMGRDEVNNPAEGLAAAARKAASALAEQVAPYEIIFPPLPFSKLASLSSLTDTLRNEGAEGTGSGLLQALGLHLNPELPTLTVETLHFHTRAFALIEDWLRALLAIDMSRRLTPFVDAFPKDYVEHLAGQDSAPSLATFCLEYLEFNPTRNRSLDLLPALTLLKPELIHPIVGVGQSSPRPTFHYRLPDSKLGDPAWTIQAEWERWLVVEWVASSPSLMRRLAEHYSPEVSWARECDAILSDELPALFDRASS